MGKCSTKNECTNFTKQFFPLLMYLYRSPCPCRRTTIIEEKNQLDATYYFILLRISSTYFGHYYTHHQELATMMLITTLVVSVCKDGENTTIITHKRSQVLILTETRHLLQ